MKKAKNDVMAHVGPPGTLHLDSIVIRSNYRKFFDPVALQELATSIINYEVIQPILCRPLPSGLMELVSGERRYRASVIAAETNPDRIWIPSVIRELTDDQVMDIQLQENMQRADPHPIEEAAAFKLAADRFRLDPALTRDVEDEIAHRYGKKPSYVRQRIRLNELTEEWQEAYFRNVITTEAALKLCMMPAGRQEDLIKQKAGSKKELKESKAIQFQMWEFKDERPLDRVGFDITDPKLIKKAGACTTCQYNTAVAALFDEDKENPACTNLVCFGQKVLKNVNNRVADAYKLLEEDPEAIFFVNKGSMNNDVILAIREAGHKVLVDGTHCRQFVPSKEYTLEDMRYRYRHDPKMTDDKLEMEVIKSENQAAKDLKNLEKGKKNGTFKQGLIVGGSDWQIGAQIWVSIIQLETAREAAATGEATPQQLREERERLMALEAKNAAKDQEVIYGRLKLMVEQSPRLMDNSILSKVEIATAVMASIEEGMRFNDREFIYKLLGYDTEKTHYYDPVKVFADLQQMHVIDLEGCFNVAIRRWAADTFIKSDGNRFKNMRGAAIYALSAEYLKADLDIILTEQQDVADKRVKRVNKRIHAVKEALEEFESPENSTIGDDPDMERDQPLPTK